MLFLLKPYLHFLFYILKGILPESLNFYSLKAEIHTFYDSISEKANHE